MQSFPFTKNFRARFNKERKLISVTRINFHTETDSKTVLIVLPLKMMMLLVFLDTDSTSKSLGSRGLNRSVDAPLKQFETFC